MVDVDMIDCDLVGFLKSSNLQVITTELKTCETIYFTGYRKQP